mmetsp:Transcript_13899/g.44053  ORF Transcript_13899/g.44053 Transcript_13899/m.44053 type:complete len:350 (-) Transcript_13899:56-1105(-)
MRNRCFRMVGMSSSANHNASPSVISISALLLIISAVALMGTPITAIRIHHKIDRLTGGGNERHSSKRRPEAVSAVPGDLLGRSTRAVELWGPVSDELCSDTEDGRRLREDDLSAYAKCCTMFAYEPSGAGNQVIQLVNAIRFMRAYGCATMKLPDCEGEKVMGRGCRGHMMWHGSSLHLTNLVQVRGGSGIPIAPALELEESTFKIDQMMVEKEQGYAKFGCFEGGFYGKIVPGGKKGPWIGGWPYCSEVLNYNQAAVDAKAIISHDAEPLGDDVLVVHFRSGDTVNAMYSFVTVGRRSQPDSFRRVQWFQPICDAYMHAALFGRNGRPFREMIMLFSSTVHPTGLNPW